MKIFSIVVVVAAVALMLTAVLMRKPMQSPCGADGQPNEYWQAEFNKLDHEWRMYGYCLESKTVSECKKEWGK